VKKEGEEDPYPHYEKGVNIASINLVLVQIVALFFLCRVMWRQRKGECSLEILSTMEACAQG
jgi:hypothetical protein